MFLIIVRSILFQILFYANCLFWFTAAILAWPFPAPVMMWFARSWATSSIYLHELITGAQVEIRGAERIPQGPLLVAAKHHSAWETMALLLYFPKATYVLKRELLFLPLFGFHLLRAEQVPINRAEKGKAMALAYAGAQRAIARGRQILFFPEGTRRKVGAPPAYRMGVARVYDALGVACVPVAMTSGLAWPRNTFLHYPERIIVEFLDPIPPGLPIDAFFKIIQDRIETTTDRLLAEAGFQRESVVPSQTSA